MWTLNKFSDLLKLNKPVWLTCDFLPTNSDWGQDAHGLYMNRLCDCSMLVDVYIEDLAVLRQPVSSWIVNILGGAIIWIYK